MQWKSLHQVRSVAQSFGINDIFSKTEAQLKQEIELKQGAMYEPKVPLPDLPSYDARLMTKPPARKSSVEELEALLAPYKEMGLHVTFDDERWYFKHGKKTDEGTLRMPLRSVLVCARKVME